MTTFTDKIQDLLDLVEMISVLCKVNLLYRKTYFQSILFPRRSELILFSVKNITIDKMRINGKEKHKWVSGTQNKSFISKRLLGYVIPDFHVQPNTLDKYC